MLGELQHNKQSNIKPQRGQYNLPNWEFWMCHASKLKYTTLGGLGGNGGRERGSMHDQR